MVLALSLQFVVSRFEDGYEFAPSKDSLWIIVLVTGSEFFNVDVVSANEILSVLE